MEDKKGSSWLDKGKQLLVISKYNLNSYLKYKLYVRNPFDNRYPKSSKKCH